LYQKCMFITHGFCLCMKFLQHCCKIVSRHKTKCATVTMFKIFSFYLGENGMDPSQYLNGHESKGSGCYKQTLLHLSVVLYLFTTEEHDAVLSLCSVVHLVIQVRAIACFFYYCLNFFELFIGWYLCQAIVDVWGDKMNWFFGIFHCLLQFVFPGTSLLSLVFQWEFFKLYSKPSGLDSSREK